MKVLFFTLLLLFPNLCVAQEFNYNGLFYTILDSDAKTCSTKPGSLLSGGNEAVGRLELPSVAYYNGESYTLTTIGYASFNNRCGDMTDLIIPSTVLKIDDYAFAGAYSLKHLVIPENVKEIGHGAFATSKSLVSVKLNEGLSVLSNFAFSDCYELHEFVIPRTVTKVGSSLLVHTPIEKLFIECFTPPTVIDGQFHAVGQLYVPKGAMSNYLQSDDWSRYKESDIHEIDKILVFISLHEATITVGETLQLTSNYVCDDSSIPFSAEWTTSNSDVVTVDKDGFVTAKSSGTATIRYTIYASENRTYSDTCEIIVKEGAVSMVLKDSEISLKIGESKELITEIRGLEQGKSTITVTLSNDKGEIASHKCDIIVVNDVLDMENVLINAEGDNTDVYSINGIKIKSNASREDIQALKSGLYVIGGKLFLIK